MLGFCPACTANGPADLASPGQDAALGAMPLGDANEPVARKFANDDKKDGASEAAPAGLPAQGSARQPAAAPASFRKATTRPDPRAPFVEPSPARDEEFKRKLANYKKNKTPAVVFIGFSTAGKTWLLHRYIEQLGDLVNFHTPIDLVTDEKEGVRLSGTTEFLFYDIIPDDGKYCLIDTPGEYTQRLVRGELAGIWPLVAALEYASSVVVALPSDVVLLGPATLRLKEADIDLLVNRAIGSGPDREAELLDLRAWVDDLIFEAGKVRKFASGLGLAVATLSYVRAHGIDPCDREKFEAEVTMERVIDHLGTRGAFTPIGGRSGLACPTYFALTKSDRLVAALCGDQNFTGEASELNALKNDLMTMPETRFLHELVKYRGFADRRKYPLSQPADFVRNVDKLLFSRLTRFFPMARFDFVTAFFGHDYTDLLRKNHYEVHPAHGVNQMRDWLREAQILAARGDRQLSHHNMARNIYDFVNRVTKSASGQIFPTKDEPSR
jgi:hypothetical protein